MTNPGLQSLNINLSIATSIGIELLWFLGLILGLAPTMKLPGCKAPVTWAFEEYLTTVNFG